MTIKKTFAICLLIAVAAGFSLISTSVSEGAYHKFHTPEEMIAFSHLGKRAPLAPGEYFLPSSSCRGCHGYDSSHLANIAESGDDVNLVDRWESTMMAMSARDPLWRAKVSQEIMINPAHSLALQDKCTSCHAPLGRYTSLYHGNAHFGMSNLMNDTLGLDGVSCGACHAIGPGVGSSFSGNIPYDTSSHVEYGPFPSPYVGPMQLYEGFTPTYSTHMDQARLCSSCHTLITQSVDLAGNFTGGEFVEQATYHEYENSSFPANNITCQTCHMPKFTDPIIIANGASGLTPRYPFNQHKFAGANWFMLNLIKNNRDSLGVTAPVKSFDSTIIATTDMLRNKSINLDLTLDSNSVDSAFFSIKLENKAGHKFPSGYPSRRAVVQFVVIDALNDTLFRSGLFTSDKRVAGEDPAFEPHHNIIRQSNISQIYELVPGDVNSNFTSILERAAIILKDNRIPPVGFTTTHSVYDTTKISADALSDPDFNKVSTIEGSGIDHLHFNVALAGASGGLKVLAKLYYQAVPPKWTDAMFTMSSPDIDKFKTMFQGADQTPFLVAEDSLVNLLLPTGFAAIKHDPVKVWPTISMDGRVHVVSEGGSLIRSVQVLSSDGKLLQEALNTGYAAEIEIQLPVTSGIYYLRIAYGEKISYKKVVRS